MLQVSDPGTPEHSRRTGADRTLEPLVRMISLSANLCQASCWPEDGPRAAALLSSPTRRLMGRESSQVYPEDNKTCVSLNW